MLRRLLTCAVIALLVAVPRFVWSHSAPFSYLDLKIGAAGIDGTLVVHDFDAAHDLGIADPIQLHNDAVAQQHRDVLTRLMDSRLTILLNGTRAPIAWAGIDTLPERQSVRLTFHAGTARPASVRVNAVIFPYDPVHQTFINVYEDDAAPAPGDPRPRPRVGRLLRRHVAGHDSGARRVHPGGHRAHPDRARSRALSRRPPAARRIAVAAAAIVTAFTIGHSITLSLAALDVFSPPSSIVEPAIALSIIFVGADNLLVQRDARVAAGRGRAQPHREAAARHSCLDRRQSSGWCTASASRPY